MIAPAEPVADAKIIWASAVELAGWIREGRTSSRRALDVLVARHNSVHALLNAVVVLDLARARARADAADEAAGRGEIWGALHGVPMTVKENNDAEGLPTTMGNPERADHVAATSEVMVARMQAAGAVVWGKTNLPVDAMDVQSYNPIYGSTSNPWDLSRTPGGSSGGSAVAVAVGITPIELGGDVGGSIRIPAAFTGVFGHKPTWGVIPKRGPSSELYPREISVRGPFARCAEDLKLSMEIIAGADEESAAAGWRLELPRPDPRKTSVSHYRVAVWADETAYRVDDELVAAAHRVANALEARGAFVNRTTRPRFDIKENVDVYIALTAANAAASGVYDGPVTLAAYRMAKEKQQAIRAAWRSFFAE